MYICMSDSIIKQQQNDGDDGDSVRKGAAWNCGGMETGRREREEWHNIIIISRITRTGNNINNYTQRTTTQTLLSSRSHRHKRTCAE